MRVDFKGGPLGGESVDHPNDMVHKRLPISVPAVPVRQSLSYTLCAPSYEIHTYVWEDWCGVGAIYRWQDTSVELRKKNRQLAQSVDDLRGIIADLEERPADLVEAIEALVLKTVRDALA